MIKVPFITGIILLSWQVNAQMTFSFDTYNTNDTLVEEIYSSTPIDSGIHYCMQVTGTYSIWIPSYWSNPCGLIETAPIYPSPIGNMTGNVGFDFEYKFSYPHSSACLGETFPAPATPFPRMEITLDNGVSWFHPTTSTPFNSNHSYLYEIVGQGYPIGIRQNSPPNSDDYGILMFEFEYCESTSNSLNTTPEIIVNMPNVFTPNGDGTNEIFEMQDDLFESFEIVILNRWGNVVHHRENATGTYLWDGLTEGGDRVADGIYFYKLYGTLTDGTIGEKHGSVTVIENN